MGGGGQRHAPAAVSIVQEAGWTPGPVWTGAENLAPTGTRFPDRPARSQSLCRLSYFGPPSCLGDFQTWRDERETCVFITKQQVKGHPSTGCEGPEGVEV